MSVWSGSTYDHNDKRFLIFPGLNENGVLSLDGAADITVNSTTCTDALWFCTYVYPGTDADYSDSNTDNNWHCLDIADKKSCDTGQSWFNQTCFNYFEEFSEF